LSDKINKIKVLDTNVLIVDPKAIFKYPKEMIIIPLSVIQELDKLKTGVNQVAINARLASRLLVKLRKRGKIINEGTETEGLENSGIELDNKARLKIVKLNSKISIPKELDASINDNKILATAIHYHQKFSEDNIDVKLVTRDFNMILISDAFDVPAEMYEEDSVGAEDRNIYQGYHFVNNQTELSAKQKISSEEVNIKTVHPNEFLMLKTKDGNFWQGRYDKKSKKFLKLKIEKNNMMGILPKNPEQIMLSNLLLDKNIPLITVTGKAGTGKTLLAIASALEMTLNGNNYEKILISRPVIPLGNQNLGFLKGDLKEKLAPWMRPIYDNLELIFNEKKHKQKTWQELEQEKIIQVEALMVIRGRSIPGQIMIVDEAQNLTPHEIKTIITRVGDDTKIIFTGDPFQVDNAYLDEYSNGLSYLINHMKDDELMGHIHLSKGERSLLAERAADKLK
jgi:PhoH-like ATPase